MFIASSHLSLAQSWTQSLCTQEAPSRKQTRSQQHGRGQADRGRPGSFILFKYTNIYIKKTIDCFFVKEHIMAKTTKLLDQANVQVLLVREIRAALAKGKRKPDEACLQQSSGSRSSAYLVAVECDSPGLEDEGLGFSWTLSRASRDPSSSTRRTLPNPWLPKDKASRQNS